MTRRHRLLTISMAGVLGVVAGCSGASTPAPSSVTTTIAPSSSASASSAPSASASAAAPSVSVGSAAAYKLALTAVEYSYQGPNTTPAGLTTVTLTNSGKEEHQAQLAKLADNTTLQQFGDALKNPDPTAALKLITLTGGPNGVAPGQSLSTTQNLAPGQYVFLCFVSAPDGLPHFAKGMLAPLQVTGSAAAGDPATAEATVTAKDFSFDVPSAPLKAGKHTFTLVNNGPQPHEASFVKLPAGMTADQLKAILLASPAPGQTPDTSGPPPWTAAGGGGAIAPNSKENFEVDASTPGNYAFLCFIPDPNTGKAHFELGMIAGVTVQ
jgi:plastocyanin